LRNVLNLRAKGKELGEKMEIADYQKLANAVSTAATALNSAIAEAVRNDLVVIHEPSEMSHGAVSYKGVSIKVALPL